MLYDKPIEIDFGSEKSGQGWQVINDGVMGGRSQGKALMLKNSILFQGKISLENNGGFSSLRSTFRNRDLSAFKEVELRLKSKGQTFAFTLETSDRFYQPNYKYLLELEGDDWETINIDLKSFDQYRMGQATGKKIDPALLSKIIRMGFINTGKKAGDFSLEVDYIKFK